MGGDFYAPDMIVVKKPISYFFRVAIGPIFHLLNEAPIFE